MKNYYLFYLQASWPALNQCQRPGMVDVSIIATGDVVTDSLFVEDGEGNVIDTIVVSFALSSDDAEQENDEIDALYDDDLDAGWEGQEGDENILTMGLRFQNITIPQGATIDSAFIIVYSHEAKLEDDVANVTIYADDTDNAITFSEDSLITDRAATAAQVDWVVAEEWQLWEAYSTPDLKSVVQEIVDRSGWSSGNAIAFVLAGENQGVSDVENAREMESYENISDPEDEDANGTPGDGQNHPERAPRLIVYYNGYSTSVEESNNVDNLSVYPSVVTNGQIVISFEGSYSQKVRYTTRMAKW